MYYKLCNDILYRRYSEYGLITDNSDYGYRMINDKRRIRPEKYVTQSGALMLESLSKNPRSIDDIVNELSNIFIGVNRGDLKNDTVEFFQYFVDEGYLSVGESPEKCVEAEFINDSKNKENTSIVINADDCVKDVFKTKEFLRSIHIEIASACNERCVHCYIPHKYKEDIIDSKLFYRIIDEGRNMNIIHVTLSGGEPLLHRDIIGFLKKCRESDLSVNVLSNLVLLSDDIIEEMKKNPLLSVQTSMYSMNPDIHDGITKQNGSLNKTINSVNKLLDAEIPVQISCPVMKQNKEDFVNVIRWGYKNNISVAVEPEIFASYDHSCENLCNRLSLEEIGKAIDYELEEGYADMITNLALEKENLNSEDPICSICRYSFCISALGDVYPCVGWQSNVIGNLKFQTLSDIWERSEVIQELRKIKRRDFIKCVECKDRGYCTVCMMSNSNENQDGDAFRINEFHCRVAELRHKKIIDYKNRKILIQD